MKNKMKGFTLIELMVSVTIVAVLTAIGVVSYSSLNKNARNGKRKADLEQVRVALELYRSDNNSYPGTSADLTTTISLLGQYLTNANIQDPKPTGVYRYTYATTDSGRTYTICAKLEPATGSTPVDYCLVSP